MGCRMEFHITLDGSRSIAPQMVISVSSVSSLIVSISGSFESDLLVSLRVLHWVCNVNPY